MCQLWNELCELISKHPDQVKSLKVEPIIRQGIKRYSDQVGLLWNSLADYYIRSGHFEKVCVWKEIFVLLHCFSDFLLTA